MSLFYTSEVTCEPFVSLLLLTSLSVRGCFDSSLCLCLCLCGNTSCTFSYYPHREVPVPLWWEPHNLAISDSRAAAKSVPFPKPRALVLPLVHTLVNPNLKGTMVLIQLTLISCIINSIFSFFNGTQARRAKILPTLFPQPVGSSMRLFYRKPVIMFRTSPISLWRSLATRTSLSCSTRIPLSLTLYSSHIQGRLYEQMYLGYDFAHCSRPPETSFSSLSGSPTVTFCSVHIHNVVAKKRDASTDLLQRLHGYMREHNVDFIGGDFNMSAFSTVGDVFTDDEFSAPGNSLLWGLGALDEPNRECTGFSSCQSDLTSGVSIHMAATSLTMRCLAWDLETNLLIFRCSFIFAIPICLDPAVSCVVSKHNKEDLSADMT